MQGSKEALEKLEALAARIVQLETTLNDGRAAPATAATGATADGGQVSRRAGTGLGVDTQALGRPISFSGENAKERDWSVVFTSHAGLVCASLTTLLLHAEVADPVALSSSLQADGTILTASLDLCHLLLYLATSPAPDTVVTSGDGGGLAACPSLVARWGPQLRSRTAAECKELERMISLFMRQKTTDSMSCKCFASPRECSHAGLVGRANAHSVWWTCQECEVRWPRVPWGRR